MTNTLAGDGEKGDCIPRMITLLEVVHEIWSRMVVDPNLITRDIKQEEVYVADEAGLQGRFEQAIDQIIGAVCGLQTVNIRFGDFKSIG